ncbi:MAG: PIG-L deacetylase family protein [Acidobacteriota bacterium]
MLTCSLDIPAGRPLSILCLGAHSDDIEIGCGGAILKLLSRHPGTRITWIVFSANGSRIDEARKGASAFTQSAGDARIEILEFRDGFFPYEAAAIKEYFESLKARIAPDLIFTHSRSDRHQDHRVISDLTWNTFRSHLIWEYEIPKYDGDFGSPNLFVTLDEAETAFKCQTIMETFASQVSKHWLTEDLLRSVLRIRGMESGGSRYAEAFYTRKLVL